MNKNWVPVMSGAVLLLLLSGCAALGLNGQRGEEARNTTTGGSSDPGEANSGVSEPYYEGYRIVTLLPKDAIPAIDNPQFLSADEADSEYEPGEQVIGVNFDGDARAYSTGFLSSHEIVNDTVGGRKIAVTW